METSGRPRDGDLPIMGMALPSCSITCPSIAELELALRVDRIGSHATRQNPIIKINNFRSIKCITLNFLKITLINAWLFLTNVLFSLQIKKYEEFIVILQGLILGGIIYVHSMKKSILFCFFLLSIFNISFGQNETRKSILITTAKSLELESRATYSAAIISAKEKGWPLYYKSRNNTTASLIGIDAFGQPKYVIGYSDPVQSTTVNANRIWPNGIIGLNLSGSNDSLTNKLGIWDEAQPRLSHNELIGRVQQKDNASKLSDHATHALGIMMSTGVNPLAKGMAYNIKGAYAYDWNNDASEMAAAAANGMLISNHSYGIVSGWDYNSDSARWEFNGKWNEKEDYKFGMYDQDAQTYDSIEYNAPYYLIVKSAGNNRSVNGPAVGQTYWRRNQNGKWYNAGARPDSLSSNNSYGIIPTDVNAKNLLTIGAVAGISAGYFKKEDVVMTTFSNWGPTDDGRIKPDIVGDGLSVFSAISSTDSSYANLSGTSMSSPDVAGSLILLQDLSQKLTKKYIRAATVKALAIHTADESGLFPGPDYKFGWGLLNISDAAVTLNNALSSKNASTSVDLVYEKTLQNGQTDTYSVKASGIKPIKATIVWTDVKGPVESTLNDTSSRLVNDLDLKITNASNSFLPWTLDPNVPDNPAIRGNNRLDNVEKVEVDSTLVGTSYTITVNHKGNLDRGKQDYSIIISGAGGSTYCLSTPTSSAGTRIDSTSINNIQFANTSTNQYIDNSKYIINGEANGNLIAYLKLGSADATNLTRFVKIFIDYNNNGIFEDAETVATSTALTNGEYKVSIALPGTLQIGSITKLRIVVMETDNSNNVKACDSYLIGETQDYTLKISNPSTDLSITDLINPAGTICNKAIQYITVKLVNNGSTAQSNIPLNLVVKDGETTVLNINEVFKGRLNSYESMTYTFQKPINIASNKTYTITANVNVTSDQQKGNNTLSTSFTSSNGVAAPVAVASNCNSQLSLTVKNANTSSNYIWYDSSSLQNPIGIGSSLLLGSSKNKFYLTQGFQSIIDPINNSSLGSTGSYNSFSGNFVRINATGPLTIETAKLYTGYPGKITFTLGTIATENSNGTYSYYPVQSVNLNVDASSPSPAYPYDSVNKVNAATPFVSADSGKIYALNLSIPRSGDYILIVACDSASIFRNNGLSNNTYPIGPNKLFSFTGNSVSASSGNFQNYFYFFYSTQISTNDCLSPTTIVPVQTSSIPTFTKASADSLVASAGTSYQWYLNDTAIQGATGQSYKVLKNGTYKVAVTASDCQAFSSNLLILVRDVSGNLITDVPESNPKEINLKIYSADNIENLIKGNSFFVQFSAIQTQDISLELVNSSGNKVFQAQNLINQTTPQRITIENLNTGVYFVKIYANKKVYVQRVFITNN